jgi:hypothetical protein
VNFAGFFFHARIHILRREERANLPSMDRVNQVLDRVIQVFVLGIILTPVVLYLLLVLFAFSFYLVSRLWPCDWPWYETLGGFNPDCPNWEPAD